MDQDISQKETLLEKSGPQPARKIGTFTYGFASKLHLFVSEVKLFLSKSPSFQ